MKSIKDYITVSIAITALVISAVTFYLTKLYDPGVSFEISPRLEWITNNFDQETFVLPVTITNNGARGYVVNQIVLQIKGHNLDPASRYIANKFAVRRATPSEFAPESLTSGSSVARSYLFERFEAGRNTVRDVSKAPTSPASFAFRKAGEYDGTVLVRLNGSSVYTVAKKFTFRVNAAEIDRLRQKPYGTQIIFNVQTAASSPASDDRGPLVTPKQTGSSP